MTPRKRPLAELLKGVPDATGVYLFLGPSGEHIYVGKSKTLRKRVQAHIRDRSERWMMQRVRSVEIRETAGELGALLLEQRLIKELRPMYNVASKQKRRIILALRKETPAGYVAVTLRAVDRIDQSRDDGILGVFKHHTQAKEFFGTIAKTHGLCGKLLGLERTRSYCFSYHLGRCRGACMGEEPAILYNERVEAAFEERRIRSWPFKGGIAVEEGNDGRQEIFLVENWCLMGSLTRMDGASRPFVPSTHRFDYDTYKILYGFIAEPAGRVTITQISKKQWLAYLREVEKAKARAIQRSAKHGLVQVNESTE